MYGLFYTIEGIDGSGKTTVMETIDKFLTELDIPHVMVSAYPKDEDSMRLRKLWINQELPPAAEATVILELRRRVLVNEIIPAIRSGKVVISDRYNDSTYVYQKVARGVPTDIIQGLMDYQLQCIQDLRISRSGLDQTVYRYLHNHRTLHLDISAKTAVTRLKARGNQDAFERNKEDYFQRLIDGYRKHYQTRRYWGTVSHINAELPIDEVNAQVLSFMAGIFGNY